MSTVTSVCCMLFDKPAVMAVLVLIAIGQQNQENKKKHP